ncbi:MAG TPA: cupin domain-containing protein [Bacteroidota bacterium]|nr:cupin domain-containing protein [Bacteroidota bacterium]
MKIDKDLLSVALNSASAIEYVKGSVVSRQIIKSEAGTITLFAFDKDQSLSEHTASFNAFVQVVDGKAEFVVGTKRVVAMKDEFIILPANIPHAVHAIERFKMILIMIKG